MSVRLIAITKPVLPEIPDAEGLLSYCARVSNPSNQENFATGGRLLKYCLDHSHFSVFEMGHAILEIETSRAIAAQILRHRSFSFQEFSTRYSSELPNTQQIQPRRQAAKNRQSSTDDLDETTANWFMCAQYDVETLARTKYEEAIKRGVAREQARFLLPLSTGTRMYMAGSIRSWVHYVQLRCQEDTQLEHRVIAEQARSILAKELPTVAEALGWPSD